MLEGTPCTEGLAVTSDAPSDNAQVADWVLGFEGEKRTVGRIKDDPVAELGDRPTKLADGVRQLLGLLIQCDPAPNEDPLLKLGHISDPQSRVQPKFGPRFE